MILVDMNQVTLSNLMVQIGSKKELDPDLVRHMVLNSLRSYRSRFTDEFGELVLCYDNKTNWRRDIFPNYKYSRRKDRKNSKLDWNSIFDALHLIRDELIEYFPYKVLQVENAEADDIIASVVFHVAAEPKNYEKVLILSGDKDFIQLHHKNVQQWSPVTKKLVNGIEPHGYLFEHILKGDKSDGIPNILSADDSIVNGVRQKPITKKYIDNFVLHNAELNGRTDTEIRNFHRNEKLIDLKKIPEVLEKVIMVDFLSLIHI